MSLLDTDCRCFDDSCSKHERCLRWLERDTRTGPGPSAETLRVSTIIPCPSFLPMQKRRYHTPPVRFSIPQQRILIPWLKTEAAVNFLVGELAPESSYQDARRSLGALVNQIRFRSLRSETLKANEKALLRQALLNTTALTHAAPGRRLQLKRSIGAIMRELEKLDVTVKPVEVPGYLGLIVTSDLARP
jgi:hypothetical protein